jgi:hypothetical protein
VYTILILIAVVIVGILIYVSTKPNEFHIQRSLSINALPESLFPLINDFHQMQKWSAWEKIDPTMKRDISTVASGVGAKYAWAGNKEIGQGTMAISASEPYTKIAMHMHFIKPFEGHSDIEYSLAQNGSETLVTQTMRGTSTFIPKLMCVLFINQDKMIGSKFEEGLANLKALAEQ